eukprot:760348-Hanusia_phi.AAC.3
MGRKPLAIASVTVHGARELPAAQLWTSSFCIASLRHQECFTDVEEGAAAPMWNFSSSLAVYDLSDKIRISVMRQGRVSSSSSSSSSSCEEIGHIVLPIRMAQSMVEVRSSWYVLQDDQQSPVVSQGKASALCVSMHIGSVNPGQEEVSACWMEGWADVRRGQGKWQRCLCSFDPWGPRLVCFPSSSESEVPSLVFDLRKFLVDSSSSSKLHHQDEVGEDRGSSFPYRLALIGQERREGRQLPVTQGCRGYTLLDGTVFLAV